MHGVNPTCETNATSRHQDMSGAWHQEAARQQSPAMSVFRERIAESIQPEKRRTKRFGRLARLDLSAVLFMPVLNTQPNDEAVR